MIRMELALLQPWTALQAVICCAHEGVLLHNVCGRPSKEGRAATLEISSSQSSSELRLEERLLEPHCE